MSTNDLRGFPKYVTFIDCLQPTFIPKDKAVGVGFYAIDQSTHEHQYNKKGECSCGKVLPDIRPYPQV